MPKLLVRRLETQVLRSIDLRFARGHSMPIVLPP
jgi:hypothetical protein